MDRKRDQAAHETTQQSDQDRFNQKTGRMFHFRNPRTLRVPISLKRDITVPKMV